MEIPAVPVFDLPGMRVTLHPQRGGEQAAERFLTTHPSGAEAVLVVAGEPDAAGSPASVSVPMGSVDFRDGAKAGRLLGDRHADVAATATSSGLRLRHFLEGLLLALYRPRLPEQPRQVRIVVRPSAVGRAVEAIHTARAVLTARVLANMPGNVKSPEWLAGEVTRLAEAAGITATRFDRAELSRLGAGGLLGVAAGSAHDPVLLRLDHEGPGARGPHVGLVGKGITFDSGGLSIKPAASMPLMKTDMSGAAAVAATMLGAAWRGLPIRATAWLAIAENMPGAAAMRPGDVLTHPNGRTTEVLNTDAEGRLVLADALALANGSVDVLVDVATLTGAATLGLSRYVAALYSPDDRLAAALGAAARSGGEGLWRMPLVPEYAAAIDSTVADAANTATDPNNLAGSITAAWFLAPFAAGSPWAHLDIAGPARAESDRDGFPKGATGYGVRTLLEWLAGGARGVRVPRGARSA